MKKTIAPAGSKLSLPLLFDGVQNDMELNRMGLIKNLFSDFGTLYDGAGDTSLELSQFDTSTIEVAPGFGICEAGHLIEVKSEDSAGSKRLTITDGFDNSVYIKHEHITDTPTDILDGFVWVTTSGGLTADTQQYDFFSLTTTDPGISGIELANVARSGASITVTDLRDTNRLIIYDALLSSGTQEKLHYQNTDIGTDSETFRVGVGSLNDGAGYPVQIGRDESAAPVDVRIEKMNYYIPSSYNTSSTELPFSIVTGLAEPYLKVKFVWGHKVFGTGSTGQGGINSTFTITSFNSPTGTEFQTFGLNELAGQYFYIDSSTQYSILSNTAGTNSVLTLDTEVTIPSTSGDYFKINSNADDYIWEAIPVDPNNSDEELEDDRIDGIVATRFGGMVRQFVEVKLNLGWRYKFRVIGRQNGFPSDAKDLLAGSFSQGGTTYTYDSPVDAIIDTTAFDMTGMDVTAAGTDYGFEINITKPTNETPTDYEIVYNTVLSGSADFANANHEHLITSQTKVQVTTNNNTVYNIKVRPLLGGQVVNATPTSYVEVDVLSGGGGYLPNDKVLPAIYVDMKSDSNGFVVPNTVTKHSIFASYILEFNANSFIDGYYTHHPAYDNTGQGYFVTSNDTDTVNLMDDINFQADATTILESGIYVGNTVDQEAIGNEPINAAARAIFTHTFPQDIRIISVDFDCKQTTATGPNPGIIRFYQKNFSEQAKSLEITSTGFATYPVDLDVLSSLEANRTMVIDAWDPTDVNNGVDIRGTLTVKYRDKVQEIIMTR